MYYSKLTFLLDYIRSLLKWVWSAYVQSENIQLCVKTKLTWKYLTVSSVLNVIKDDI